MATVESQEGTSSKRADLGLAGAVGLLPLLVFAPVTSFEFLNFDDDVYVTANPHVQAGLTPSTVRWAFSNVESGHFHPLTWLSHALDVTLFGLEAGAHHRTTLLLHALATALCFVFWRRLGLHATSVNPENANPISRGVAFFAAALFAVHPLRVESVAWVATRKDVLSGVLFFATLLMWLWWKRAPSAGRMAGTASMFALALLAKPTVLPLPLLLLALEAWPLRESERLVLRIRRLAPLFVLSMAFSTVAIFGQHAAGSMASLDGLPLPVRVSNASIALVTYAGRLLAPFQTSLFHPLMPMPLGLGVACGAALVLISVAAWRGLVPRSLGMAWTWFVVLLLPVCGLVQIGGQFIADRWLYLPLSGVVVGLAVQFEFVGARKIQMALGVAIVALCAMFTRQALPDYRTSELVFRHALAVQADNFLAHTNLGTALEQRGAFDEARVHFEEALRLNPTWPTALVNLGNARAREGRLTEAEALYDRALERSPDMGLAHYNLGLTLVMVGRATEALPHYERAVQLRPLDAMAELGLGAALVNLGQVDEGAAHLRRSTQLDGRSAEAWAHLGKALKMLGQAENAGAAIEAALAIDPMQPLALQLRR